MTTLNLSRILSALFVIVLCGVITAAFGFQYVTGEKPCPLCFIQRLAMIGIAVGQLMNFRFGFHMSHHAISLFHCIFGAATSLRQIGLHICPTFGKFGSPLLGFSLYVWAFVVFVCSIFAIGVLMWLYNPKWRLQYDSKWIDHLERFAFWYTLVIIVADIIAATMICGIKPCPDNP